MCSKSSIKRPKLKLMFRATCRVYCMFSSQENNQHAYIFYALVCVPRARAACIDASMTCISRVSRIDILQIYNVIWARARWSIRPYRTYKNYIHKLRFLQRAHTSIIIRGIGTRIMADFDLTAKIGQYLDRHLVFPLLEFLSVQEVSW